MIIKLYLESFYYETMESLKNKMYVIHLWAIFLIIEMIILWFFSPPSSSLPIPILENFFWILWVPAVILIILPFVIFHKKGGVAKGDSYVNTQKLVDSGIFSIIRHPQYTGGMWIAIAILP
ncbi:MAG: hypothetical protein ACTSR8_15225 [Promethearchaeota archaeon]